MRGIAAILFDKDGTLFGFQASWGRWAAALLDELAAGDAARRGALAAVLGYDPVAARFAHDSPVIAETPEVVARLILPLLPEWTEPRLVARMNAMAADAPMVEAVPLAPLLAALRARGLWLGVATNDAEAPARAHLETAGLAAAFDFVAGFDSGHGAKPEPGMLLAFASACGVAPGQVAMVGDSRHDLLAGRAAGMRTIGVLTGPARAAELAPLADVVLPDIGHLPALLDRAGQHVTV